MCNGFHCKRAVYELRRAWRRKIVPEVRRHFMRLPGCLKITLEAVPSKDYYQNQTSYSPPGVLPACRYDGTPDEL
jgi:hypothetical protein